MRQICTVWSYKLALSGFCYDMWHTYECLLSDISKDILIYPALNLRPWYWNSFLYSLISSGESSAFAHFAVAIANHYNLAFLFHQVPIPAGWTEAA